MNPKDRFEKFVNKTESCHIFTGGIIPNGYGLFYFNGKAQGAHRVAYQLFIGKIPKGKHICHTCDVRACVNPKHLWLGTHKQNMKDRNLKHRTAKGIKNGGAKLTLEQVLEIRNKYKPWKYTLTMLAKEYKVSYMCIFRIAHQTHWKN